MLEVQKHEASFFVTLTYSEEHLPCDGSVSVRHAQLYLKRLRSMCHPRKVRYYVVGEYGDRTKRPHYHLALFGLLSEKEIRDSWSYGHVHVGTLTQQSSAYLVSYVVKALTKKADARLGCRAPEFARMSLKPGIGAGAMEDFGKALTSKGGAKYVAVEGDVPTVIRSERKKWPLGRYLRRKLREAIGMEAGAPAQVLERLGREGQQELYSAAGRELRESKRIHAGRKAQVLESITRSKKGIGL